MILQFEFRNYKSVRDWQTFSLLAEKSVSERKETVMVRNNIHILSSAVIYGRNASGKSNLLKAVAALQNMVVGSAKYESGARIANYQPYKLDVNNIEQPVEFKIEFIAKDGIKYRYEIAFTARKIEYERLFHYPKTQSARLFEREGMQIIYGEKVTGRKKDIEDTLYENQLYLSKVGSDRLEALFFPYRFFYDAILAYLDHDAGLDETLLQLYSARFGKEHHSRFNANLTKLIRAADINIESFIIRDNQIDLDVLPEDMDEKDKRSFVSRYRYQARSSNRLFNGDKQVGLTELRLSEQSTGTLKLIILGGLIIEALETGQILLIDELDKSLHPKLTRALIDIFNEPKSNPNGAQLIFATHDVTLLDNDLFRRDQIWLAEKEYQGCSHYYAVSDIGGIRKDTALSKWYFDGRFGGTPVIKNEDFTFEFEDGKV